MKQNKPHYAEPIRQPSPITSDKLICIHHKEQIIRICAKPYCKYRRYFCNLCITSTSQKKHLVEHTSLISLEELLKPFQSTIEVNQSIKGVDKYFLDVRRMLDIGRGQFKKYVKYLWERSLDLVFSSESLELFKHLQNILTSDQQMCNSLLFNSKDIEELRGIKKSLKNTTMKQVLQPIVLLNVVSRHILIKLMLYIENMSKRMINSFRLKDNPFIPILKSCDKIDISKEQDIKKLKNGTQSVYLAISLQGFKQPDDIEKLVKKICPMYLQGLTFSFLNFPDDCIMKLELPSKCNQFTFNLSNKLIKNNTIDNLKNITKIFKQSDQKHRILETVSILCSNSEIVSSSMVQNISQWIGMFTNIKCIKLDFRCNKIKTIGVYYLMVALEKLETIQDLEIDFGGFGEYSNNLEKALGQIGVTLRKLKGLRNLCLGLAHTNISDSDILELGNSILQLSNLQNLLLGFQMNSRITDIQSFAQKLSFSRVSTLSLCLDGIDIRMHKLVYIIQCFNFSQYLKDASISAKNCNLFEEKSTQKKSIRSPKVKIKLSY